jgi:hypothetical protein
MLHLLGERLSNGYAKRYWAIFPQICELQVKIVIIVLLLLGNSPAEFLRTRNNAAESRSLNRQLSTDAVARATERVLATDGLGPQRGAELRCPLLYQTRRPADDRLTFRIRSASGGP